MSEQEAFDSSSDESDADYCPDKAANSGLSEEESDDPISDVENEATSTKKSKQKHKVKTSRKKTKDASSDEEEGVHVASTRSRRRPETGSSLEQDELKSDDEDPKRKDALWADFLSDVPGPAPVKKNTQPPPSKLDLKLPDKKRIPPEQQNQSERVEVIQKFDFAGEEVEVKKLVDVNSLKENDLQKRTAGRPGVKRGSGGALGSVLGQLGKKKKISVLEKSKLDWDNFKSEEGIEEQLSTFNKGKDGYLERQDFLQRTDVRQFEIEKSLRQATRKPM